MNLTSTNNKSRISEPSSEDMNERIVLARPATSNRSLNTEEQRTCLLPLHLPSITPLLPPHIRISVHIQYYHLLNQWENFLSKFSFCAHIAFNQIKWIFCSPNMLSELVDLVLRQRVLLIGCLMQLVMRNAVNFSKLYFIYSQLTALYGDVHSLSQSAYHQL